MIQEPPPCWQGWVWVAEQEGRGPGLRKAVTITIFIWPERNRFWSSVCLAHMHLQGDICISPAAEPSTLVRRELGTPAGWSEEGLTLRERASHLKSGLRGLP